MEPCSTRLLRSLLNQPREDALMLVPQDFQAVLQGKAMGSDRRKRLLPDCLFNFAIGLRAVQLLFPCGDPGLDGSDVRLRRLDLHEILPEHLQSPEPTHATDGVRHRRGAVAVVTELQ
jgi:hypothetical protein